MSILKSIGRYLLSLGLIGYGAVTLYGEKAPKVTDPHAILIGLGLLILPDIPMVIANGIKTIATPIVEAWRAKNNA